MMGIPAECTLLLKGAAKNVYHKNTLKETHAKQKLNYSLFESIKSNNGNNVL